MATSQDNERTNRRYIIILLLLLIPIMFCFCCSGYVALLGLIPDQLPVGQTDIRADYSRWRGGTFAPLNWAELGTVAAGGELPSQPQIALQTTATSEVENTPRPTGTARTTSTPVATSTPRPSATLLPTLTRRPSLTPLPTNTRVPSNTPRPSATPLPSLTTTPLPSNTPLPTRTPRPSATPLPSLTTTPLPSNTPLPTLTPLPTFTLTPLPTNTPIPPVDTPIPPPPPTDTPVPVNLPPTVANDSATTPVNIAVIINVLANDSDPDGTLNPASVTISTAPTNGTITFINPATGEITYTPNLGFGGVDTFTYQVLDNLGGISGVALVTVYVGSPPVANNDTANTGQNTPVVINVIANDVDDGFIDPASVTIISGPSNGTITFINPATGEVTYAPNAPFIGTDTFTYQVLDNTGLPSNIATVTVNVCSASNPIDGTFPDGFIQSVTPANGTVGVPLGNNTIVVQFTQNMGANVSAPGQYDLRQQAIPGQKVNFLLFNYDSGTFQLTITYDTADPDWQASTLYEFQMNSSLQNQCGVAQGAGPPHVVIQFQTAP